MDDDLLADDGQYKDDGLDDLDIDAEAALLGLSDEEIEDERSVTDDQELEYVDEDGNPVAIGENNADQYEVANIESDKLSNPADEDVLELDDLDAELESFNQETTDLIDETPSPVKSYNDRQRKENLISLTSRSEQERPVIRRKESRYSPIEDKERSNKDRPNKDASFLNQSHSSRGDPRKYGDELEYDEESEDESIADDHRERFKSERSNIITLTPAKRRTDIPDTLESVINVEETAKVQAFLENEHKRKMRYKGKTQSRMKPAPRFQRPSQNYPSQQAQQPPPSQFSSPGSTCMSQTVSTAPPPQSRKILINPHFRGVRIPPPSEPAHVINETPQVSVPPISYDTSSYQPPVQYSHPETVHPVAPPPIYTAPPPAVQYKHPEYPPQQHIQQIPPPMWQPPDMTVPSYSNPPPVMNYGDPVPQHHSYTNYNQSYQNTNYQNPPMPMPQNVNYSQPPPPVHLHTQPYPSQSVNPVPSTIGHTHYPPPPSHPLPPNQGRVQQIPMQSHHYQEPMSQPQMISHAPKPRFTQSQQRFSRPLEKRGSSTNIRAVPIKQARIEPPQRKSNVHVNNSNIREIPLVDSFPVVRKAISANKVVPIVEDEDEKTKELRMKIEEQKLLREQILKRKEERRRQMAAQRLMDLKKRQAEQNKNTVTIVPKVLKPNNNQQANQVKVAPSVKPAVKPSVKERIGLPLNQAAVPTKKKIVVVRKKVPPQNTVNVSPSSTPNLSPVIVGQRLRLPIPSQKQNIQQMVKPPTTAAQENILKPSPKVNTITNVPKPETPKKVVEAKAPNPPSNEKPQPSNTPKKVVFTPQGTRGIGNRPSLQRPRPFTPRIQRLRLPGHRTPGPRALGPRTPGPRAPGPRASGPRSSGPRSSVPRRAQFPPPRHFMEQRMSFPNQGHPVNEMGMRSPRFQEPRPPLLFHPPGEHGPYNQFFPHDRPFESNNNQHFRMRSPVPQNFRPRGMEPMFRDRFPSPQFPNQMQQMRPMFENNMQRFPRHRFQNPNKPRFSSNNANNFNQKHFNQPKIATKPPVSTPSTPSTPSSAFSNATQKVNNTAEKNNEVKQVPKVTLARNQPKSQSDDKDVSKTHSVSVANLSSSTSEAQLKKLCSSVGVVENIQLIKSERKAVIKFKEPRQALSFQKKYQSFDCMPVYQ